MRVTFTVEFLFGEFVLKLTNLIENPFVFAIFDSGEDGVIHNFDENAVFPENLALLKGKNNNSGMFDGPDNRNKKILDVIQIDKLLGQHLVHRQFQPIELFPCHPHQHIDVVHHIFTVEWRLRHCELMQLEIFYHYSLLFRF